MIIPAFIAHDFLVVHIWCRDETQSTCRPAPTPATVVGTIWDARFGSQATVKPARWHIQCHFASFTMQRMGRGRIQGRILISRPQPPVGIAEDPHTRRGPPAAFWQHAQGIGHCRSPVWPHAAAPCRGGRSAEKKIFSGRGKRGPSLLRGQIGAIYYPGPNAHTPESWGFHQPTRGPALMGLPALVTAEASCSPGGRALEL